MTNLSAKNCVFWIRKILINYYSSRYFLFSVCAAIFLLSIFLRSFIDIGADTAIYIDVGRKIAKGGKYYYDFFESNFPISFYFYALQSHLSSLLN